MTVELLLDTHVALWWLAGARLDADAVAAIAAPGNRVVVSAASLWEANVKRAIGKLETAADLSAALAESGFDELPVRWSHAERLLALPAHHRDSFDRMLVAQALVEDLTVVTRDAAFAPYGVAVLDA
jgi:PIN domain nuclease of toxin-antitoxin system